MEWLGLGPTPTAEDCQQVGTDAYDAGLALAECRAYKAQLIRFFGEPPAGAALKIRGNRHDFGTYHEVYVGFSGAFGGEASEAEAYATGMDDALPEYWDNEAVAELAAYQNKMAT